MPSGDSTEPDVEMGGCPAIGVLGLHSDGYADGDPCQWCGAVSRAMRDYLSGDTATQR